MDGYLASALLVEDLENLLVLRAVQIELVLLERLAVLKLLVFATQAEIIH